MDVEWCDISAWCTATEGERQDLSGFLASELFARKDAVEAPPAHVRAHPDRAALKHAHPRTHRRLTLAHLLAHPPLCGQDRLHRRSAPSRSVPKPGHAQEVPFWIPAAPR